ncbi:MAG TPA: RQC domain-containing protein, partial [Candidatus Kapabacteria bacterium]|nr:RQC domain-containing protein [Candidatus Kapabacteria bacterium]
LDLPKSIEAYYQETGRAGRDGEPATALLLYGLEDVVKLGQMMAQSEGNEQFKRMERQRLDAMLGLCEITSCRRQALLRYFGEEDTQPCGNCDSCLLPPKTWDGTDAVRKLLSCIYRTGQRFGANHVIDVLRGSSSEKILGFEHHKLSTHGIGKEFSATEWKAVVRQLVARGYLAVDADAFGALRLTESCRPLLRGEESIQLRKEVSASQTKATRTPHDDMDEQDVPLWNALRACRKRIAEQLGMPPYVVFHDSTLREMVAQRPVTERALLQISGVGDSKLQKFGDAFLQVIREYEYVEE